MKTSEELRSLKQAAEELNRKRSALTEDELRQAAGRFVPDPYDPEEHGGKQQQA